jgi:nucleoside-specific outer membrane channel protein Tsx
LVSKPAGFLQNKKNIKIIDLIKTYLMKNVTLYYSGKSRNVNAAVNKANEILASESFYQQIRAYHQFDNSAFSPEVIARLMESSGHRIKVKVNWFVPILRTNHDKITVSGWGFSSNLAAEVHNLIYETVNSIDSLYDVLSNPSQSQKSVNHSVPWVIGTIAEIMVVN